MLQVERWDQIMALLGEATTLRIAEIAKKLYTSEATVRRDVAAMEQQGLLQRVYGGVTLKKEDLPIDFRHHEHAEEKDEIAKKAVELIREGMMLYIDSSSTAQHLLPLLSRFRNLTVITNSQKVVDTLAPEGRFKLICTGGEYVVRNMAYFGRIAERTMDHFCPDLAIFASKGVNARGEITDISEEETAMRVAAIKRATRSVFLCDKSKVGKTFSHHVAWMKDMDVIVTDEGFPAEYLPKKG